MNRLIRELLTSQKKFFVYGPKWLFPTMLERRQVHSHNRAKTKKAKTCIMVTKAHTSEDKVKKILGVQLGCILKNPLFTQ